MISVFFFFYLHFVILIIISLTATSAVHVYGHLFFQFDIFSPIIIHGHPIPQFLIALIGFYYLGIII